MDALFANLVSFKSAILLLHISSIDRLERWIIKTLHSEIWIDSVNTCPHCGDPLRTFYCTVCGVRHLGYPARVVKYRKWKVNCTTTIHGSERWKGMSEYEAKTCTASSHKLDDWICFDIHKADRDTGGLRRSYPSQLLGCAIIIVIIFILLAFSVK